MSFILDALKKSETERQQQSGAEFSRVPSSSDEPQSLKWLWILAALLAVNVAVLLGILLRSDNPAPSPASVTAPVVAAPRTGADSASGAAAGTSFEEQLAEARERQVDREQAAATQAEPEATAAAAPVPNRTAAPASTRRLSTIDELRLDGALQLPDLHLDIHVFSEVPDERFVFINMVKHREQSRLDEGPVVSEITPEGVILDYQGRTFLLPRE